MADFLQNSLFPVVLTLLAYQVGLVCQKKSKTPLANPILIAVILVLVCLSVTRVSIDAYQQSIQRLCVFAEGAFVRFQAEVLDVLVGVIQNRVKMAAQIGQVIVNGSQTLLQFALYLAGSVGSGFRGVRFNQIDDGFGFRQAQLAV